MALVSREVASYPMQGAVERPPAPTLSPLPNPFPCLRLADLLSLSLRISLPPHSSASAVSPSRSLLVLSRFSSVLLSFVRPSQANFHRSSSVLECVELPESHLRNQRWSLLGEPSLPFPSTLAPRYFTRSRTTSSRCVHEFLAG